MTPLAAFIDGFWFSVQLLALMAGLSTPLIIACYLFLRVVDRLGWWSRGRRPRDRA